MSLRDDALRYHSRGRPGKLEIAATKPLLSQRDLALAYSPGVAAPVEAIAEDPDLVFEYTARGNLVAVLSNGSAILGLGDLGPLAAKPVMEGKAVLFKKFADVDVFDIEVDTADPEEIIRLGQLIAPTFGGINLEDIKAPECFRIERELERTTDIPIFHDDQHGTAIISGAALLNALALAGKRIEDVHIVVNGAGAAGIACAEFYLEMGAPVEHITLCDSLGVIHAGREARMNEYKEAFARPTQRRSLADALVGADVFVGVSVADIVTQEMVRSMAADPIVFALANPDPEITYEAATEAREDVIMATGRSDYPNQVNNVLGFPFIFRGALDVRATNVNREMKLAAAEALAEMAREEVPEDVLRAYGLEALSFGRDYIIPKPLDTRVLTRVAPAVAAAAMRSGVARREIDLEAYLLELQARQNQGFSIMRRVTQRAGRDPKRVVFAEGEHPFVIRAAADLVELGICDPILVGRPPMVRSIAEELGIDAAFEVVEPERADARERYAERLYQRRKRKGVTFARAQEQVVEMNRFGLLMLAEGDADAFVSGLTFNYPDVLRPALQIVGPRGPDQTVSGVHLMVVRGRPYFFTDTTVNFGTSAEELAAIAINAADVAEAFDVVPRVAMLSYSNFGSVRTEDSERVRKAVEILHELRPDLAVDGEMQADTAVSRELVEDNFRFSRIRRANVLVFPNLDAANASYKLLDQLGGAEAVGPILVGMAKSVQVLPTGSRVRDIVNLAVMAVVGAQREEARG